MKQVNQGLSLAEIAEIDGVGRRSGRRSGRLS